MKIWRRTKKKAESSGSAYQLTNLGKWFALLLAGEEELSEQEKAEIMQNLFRIYVKVVKDLARTTPCRQENARRNLYPRNERRIKIAGQKIVTIIGNKATAT